MGLSSKNEFPTVDEQLTQGTLLKFGEVKGEREASKQKVLIAVSNSVKTSGENSDVIRSLEMPTELKAIEIDNAGELGSVQR